MTYPIDNYAQNSICRTFLRTTFKLTFGESSFSTAFDLEMCFTPMEEVRCNRCQGRYEVYIMLIFVQLFILWPIFLILLILLPFFISVFLLASALTCFCCGKLDLLKLLEFYLRFLVFPSFNGLVIEDFENDRRTIDRKSEEFQDFVLRRPKKTRHPLNSFERLEAYVEGERVAEQYERVRANNMENIRDMEIDIDSVEKKLDRFNPGATLRKKDEDENPLLKDPLRCIDPPTDEEYYLDMLMERKDGYRIFPAEMKKVIEEEKRKLAGWDREVRILREGVQALREIEIKQNEVFKTLSNGTKIKNMEIAKYLKEIKKIGSKGLKDTRFFEYAEAHHIHGKNVNTLLERIHRTIARNRNQLEELKKEYVSHRKFFQSQKQFQNVLEILVMARCREIDAYLTCEDFTKFLLSSVSHFTVHGDLTKLKKSYFELRSRYQNNRVEFESSVLSLIAMPIEEMDEHNFDELYRPVKSIVKKGFEAEKILMEFWEEKVKKKATKVSNLCEDFLLSVTDHAKEKIDKKKKKKKGVQVDASGIVNPSKLMTLFYLQCGREYLKLMVSHAPRFSFLQFSAEILPLSIKAIQRELDLKNPELFKEMERIKKSMDASKIQKVGTGTLYTYTSEFFRIFPRRLKVMIDEYVSISRKFDLIFINLQKEVERSLIASPSRPSPPPTHQTTAILEKTKKDYQKNLERVKILKDISPLLSSLDDFAGEKFEERFKKMNLHYDRLKKEFKEDLKMFHAENPRNVMEDFESYFTQWTRLSNEVTRVIDTMKKLWEEQNQWVEEKYEIVCDVTRRIVNPERQPLIMRATLEYLKNLKILAVTLKNHSNRLKFTLYTKAKKRTGLTYLFGSNVYKDGTGWVLEVMNNPSKPLQSLFLCQYRNNKRKGKGVLYVKGRKEPVDGFWDGDKCVMRNIHSSMFSDIQKMRYTNCCWAAKMRRSRRTKEEEEEEEDESFGTRVYIRKFPKVSMVKVVENVLLSSKSLKVVKIIGIVRGSGPMQDGVVIRFSNLKFESIITPFNSEETPKILFESKIQEAMMSCLGERRTIRIGEGWKLWQNLGVMLKEICDWFPYESIIMKTFGALCRTECKERKLEEIKMEEYVMTIRKLCEIITKLQDERRGKALTIGDALNMKHQLKSILDMSEKRCDDIVVEYDREIERSVRDKSEFIKFSGLEESFAITRSKLLHEQRQTKNAIRRERGLLENLKNLLPRFRDVLIEIDILKKIQNDLGSRFEAMKNIGSGGGVYTLKNKVNDIVGCQRVFSDHVRTLNSTYNRLKNHVHTIQATTGWTISELDDLNVGIKGLNKADDMNKEGVDGLVKSIKDALSEAGEYHWSPSPSAYYAPSASRELVDLGKNILTRLQIAVLSMNQFVTNFHVEGADRCCVATFSRRYLLLQDYRTEESVLRTAFTKVIQNGASGSTRLYDSMLDFHADLERRGRRGTPCVSIVVTDGDDTDSRWRKNIHRVAESLKPFSTKPLNFLFLMGVGEGIDERKMKELMELAKGEYISVRDFSKLQAAFLLLSIQIQKMVNVRVLEIETEEDKLTLGAVSVGDRVTKRPLDYGILLDISGSMDAKVNLDEIT